MSYHDKRGRFTSFNRANSVTKDGERFKLVRTLEPIKAKGDEAPDADSAEAVKEVKAKVHDLADRIAPQWLALNVVTEAVAKGKTSYDVPAPGVFSKKKLPRLAPGAVQVLRSLVANKGKLWLRRKGGSRDLGWYTRNASIGKPLTGLSIPTIDKMVRLKLITEELLQDGEVFYEKVWLITITDEGRDVLKALEASGKAAKGGKPRFHVQVKRGVDTLYITKVKRGWGAQGIMLGRRDQARAFSKGQADDMARKVMDARGVQSATPMPV